MVNAWLVLNKFYRPFVCKQQTLTACCRSQTNHDVCTTVVVLYSSRKNARKASKVC